MGKIQLGCLTLCYCYFLLLAMTDVVVASLPNFLHFNAVFGEIGQIIGPLGLAFSRLGNPGYATEYC